MDFHVIVDIVLDLCKTDPRDDHGFCVLCGNFCGKHDKVKYDCNNPIVAEKHHKNCVWRRAQEANKK